MGERLEAIGEPSSLSELRATVAAMLPQVDLPIYQGGLDYPFMFNNIRLPQSRLFAPVRRVGQRVLYHWYHWKDEGHL